MMKKLYVIGNPVVHSISPIIFRHWFNKYKIQCTYKKRLISKKNFERDVSKLILSRDCFGLNITLPFKKIAKNVVEKIDIHAKSIDAINCIYKKNGKIIGTNTDWAGYLRSLKIATKKIKIKKNKAAIIGFGGAAQAIFYALKKNGYKKIFVFVRNRAKAKNTNFLKNNKHTLLNLKTINRSIKEFDIIVNTTPNSNPVNLNVDLRLLKNGAIVSDINYSPHQTKLIKQAILKEHTVVYGLHMLIYQAAPAFKLWFGFTPKVDKQLINICLRKTK